MGDGKLACPGLAYHGDQPENDSVSLCYPKIVTEIDLI